MGVCRRWHADRRVPIALPGWNGTAIPIVLGEDVRDWWNLDPSKAVTRGIIAWDGQNVVTRQASIRLRLYLAVWDNPHPEKTVVDIDFMRVGPSDADPFCVARRSRDRRLERPPDPGDLGLRTR